MGTILGKVVGHVLVDGLRAIERVVPTPGRMGSPLEHVRRPGGTADPVVVVGGFANSASGFDGWNRSLVADGFDVHVFALPDSGLGDMERSAREVAAFVEQVKARTGSARVDVVGFSEGGLVARRWISHLGGAASVDRMISLATPAGGIDMRVVNRICDLDGYMRSSTPLAFQQMRAGSALLRSIEADDRVARGSWQQHGWKGTRYASVFSRSNDLFVTPSTAALEGALNVPLSRGDDDAKGPNHFEILHSSNAAYAAVRELLLDGSDAAVLQAAKGMRAIR